MTNTAYRIVGTKIALRGVAPSDADGPYFDWLQQPEMAATLASQKFPISRDGLRQEIRGGLDRTDMAWFGICALPAGNLIGTVRLSGINWLDRTAGIGIMIGDTAARGRGLAKEALELTIAYAFDVLNLQRVYAGVSSNNTTSLALFRSVMEAEGVRRRHVFAGGTYHDEHMFARLKP